MEWDLNRYFKQPDQKPAETDAKAVQPLPDAEETEPKRTNITAQSSKKKRRPRPLPPWILVLVSLLLYALLFHIWIRRFLPEEQVSVGRLLTLVLFSVSFALLSALIGSIGKQHRTQTVFALLVVIIWAILYLMEYFILDSFKNFYTLAGIFTGAGNAGQEDFAARTFGLVGTNLWRVLLFALPILLWFLANRFLHIPRILTRGIRRYLAGAGIALLSLAILFAALLSPDKRKLVEAYNFTGAVRGFGLPMGFALDFLHSGTESSFELEGESSFVPTAQSAGGSSEADSRPVQTDESGNLISDSTEAPVAEAYSAWQRAKNDMEARRRRFRCPNTCAP